MAVPVACPHCGHFVSVSDDKFAAAHGKTAKCNKCSKSYTVQRAVAPAASVAVSPPPSAPQPVPVVPQYTPPAAVRYATPQEEDGSERDIWSANPSLWIGFSTYFWCALLSLVCLVLALPLSAWALLGIPFCVLIVAIRVLRIKSLHYHLTSQRIRITKGILNRKIVEVELFRVRDLTIEQGFIQRLVTLGTVKAVSTDEDAQEILLSGIKDAMKVKENLRKYVMDSRKATGTRDVDASLVR